MHVDVEDRLQIADLMRRLQNCGAAVGTDRIFSIYAPFWRDEVS